MRYNPSISIIIPCRDIDHYVREYVRCYGELDYGDFEIIVLPDHARDETEDGVRVVPTGPVLPGTKRNIGAHNARGELLAFIDSDA